MLLEPNKITALVWGVLYLGTYVGTGYRRQVACDVAREGWRRLGDGRYPFTFVTKGRVKYSTNFEYDKSFATERGNTSIVPKYLISTG